MDSLRPPRTTLAPGARLPMGLKWYIVTGRAHRQRQHRLDELDDALPFAAPSSERGLAVGQVRPLQDTL